MNCNFKKILIIKYGTISEIIDSLTIIKSLKNTYPEMEIDYFTEEIPAKLLSFEKNINEIISVENITFCEVFKSARTLKSKEYDATIDLNASIKSYLLSLLIGANQTITVENTQNIPPVKNYFKAISEKIEGLDFVEKAEIQIKQDLQDHVQTAIPTDKDFVVISTQTAKYSEGKKYRLNKFKELAEKIVKKYDVEVFFTGTADERRALEIFENINPKIHNFAGRFNIIESAAFFKRAKCLIGIDSAPIYISKSLSIPTIGLFGATSPENKGFSGENTYTIKSRHLHCIPCGKSSCRLRNEEYTPCMDDISVDEILQTIEQNGLLAIKS